MTEPATDTPLTDAIHDQVEEAYEGIVAPLEKAKVRASKYKDLARQLEREHKRYYLALTQIALMDAKFSSAVNVAMKALKWEEVK